MMSEDMKKNRMLIVEDEAVVLEDLKAIMEEAGVKVVGTAVSANEAVKKTLKLKPDLVLMDIMLKGRKKGIGAAAEIKKL